MGIARRKLIAVGTTVGIFAVLGSLAYVQSSAAAPPRLGGVHIYVEGIVVQPAPPPGTSNFEHTFVMTLWGPDDALTGMAPGGPTRLRKRNPRA